jgi:hypothetical protein
MRGLIAAAAARDLQFEIYPFNVGVETRNIGTASPQTRLKRGQIRLEALFE